MARSLFVTKEYCVQLQDRDQCWS